MEHHQLIQLLGMLNGAMDQIRIDIARRINHLHVLHVAAQLVQLRQVEQNPAFGQQQQALLHNQLAQLANAPQVHVNVMPIPPPVVDPIIPHLLDYGISWYPQYITFKAGSTAYSLNPFLSAGYHRRGPALFVGMESEVRYINSPHVFDDVIQSSGIKLIARGTSFFHSRGETSCGEPVTQCEMIWNPGLSNNFNLVVGAGTLTTGTHTSFLRSLGPFFHGMCFQENNNTKNYIVTGFEATSPIVYPIKWFQLRSRWVAELNMTPDITGSIHSPVIDAADVPVHPAVDQVDVNFAILPFGVPLPIFGFVGTVALGGLCLVATLGASRTKRPEVRQLFVTLQWATGGYLVVACLVVAVIVGFNALQHKNMYTKPDWVQKFLDVPVQTEAMIPVAQGGFMLGAKALGSSIALFGLWRTYDYLRKNSTPELLFAMLAGLVCVRLSQKILVTWAYTNPPGAERSV